MKRGSQRWAMVGGLLVGAVLGVGGGYWLLGANVDEQAETAARREAMITVQALADLVEAVGGEAAALAEVVPRWAGAHPRLDAVRVLRQQGARLLFSTFPDDVEQGAPPRRLSRDEKELYDRGQRLRAAVQTNREEGVSRKEEVEIAFDELRRVVLATPYQERGELAGIVEIRLEPAPPVVPPSPWTALAFVLLPAALLALVALVAGESRWVLGLVAAVLLVVAVFGYGRVALATLDERRAEMEASVAQELAGERERTTALVAELRAAAEPAPAEEPAAEEVAAEEVAAEEEAAPPVVHEQALRPGAWDVDVYRRPLQSAFPDGTVDQARLDELTDALAADITRANLMLSLLGLVALAFIGLGGGGRVAHTVRAHSDAYLYTLPAMLGMLVLVFLPFMYGIALSFTDYTLYTADKGLVETFTDLWIGFSNYAAILGNFNVAESTDDGLVWNYANFYWTLFITIVWTVSNVAIGVSVGLTLALILNVRGLALRPIYRVLLILPWAMPNYITALIWKGMFHRQFGVINQFLQIFGVEPLSWFDSPFTSFLTALATNGWLSFPFMMVVSLGALQSIPAELYEAAVVDGASRGRQFLSITLPALRPALIPAIILSVVWTFNMFNVIYLVTAGEPAGSTEILITQSYKLAFEQYRYGYAAAYSTVIFIILLVYGTFQNRVSRATEADG